MFQLDRGNVYDCTLDEIIQKVREINTDTDPVLLENAIRHYIANYEKLEYPPGNICSGPKHMISELCRGCEIMIHADKATQLRSGFFYRYFSGILRWYAKINSTLPVLAVFGAAWLTKYQSSIFTLMTGIDDNEYHSNTEDIIGCSAYFIVLAVQAYLVSLLVGWPLGCTYAVSVVVAGILSFRMNSVTRIASYGVGWAERLRSRELEEIIRFYNKEVAAS